jgi:hypothetical protein
MLVNNQRDLLVDLTVAVMEKQAELLVAVLPIFVLVERH